MARPAHRSQSARADLRGTPALRRSPASGGDAAFGNGLDRVGLLPAAPGFGEQRRAHAAQPVSDRGSPRSAPYSAAGSAWRRAATQARSVGAIRRRAASTPRHSGGAAVTMVYGRRGRRQSRDLRVRRGSRRIFAPRRRPPAPARTRERRCQMARWQQPQRARRRPADGRRPAISGFTAGQPRTAVRAHCLAVCHHMVSGYVPRLSMFATFRAGVTRPTGAALADT